MRKEGEISQKSVFLERQSQTVIKTGLSRVQRLNSETTVPELVLPVGKVALVRVLAVEALRVLRAEARLVVGVLRDQLLGVRCIGGRGLLLEAVTLVVRICF